jgi:hypothetical protein
VQPSGRSIPRCRTQCNCATYGLAHSTMAALGNASPVACNVWAMRWLPTYAYCSWLAMRSCRDLIRLPHPASPRLARSPWARGSVYASTVAAFGLRY